MGPWKYIWQIADDCPNGAIVIHDRKSFDQYQFKLAEKHPQECCPQFEYSGSKRDYSLEDYIPNSAMLPLVSIKAAEALLSIDATAIQTFPAKLRCADGILDLVVLNIVNEVSAVNWALSDPILIPGTQSVMRFNKLSLSEEPLKGTCIARLREFRPYILACESVRTVFAGSEYCEFVEPSMVHP